MTNKNEQNETSTDHALTDSSTIKISVIGSRIKGFAQGKLNESNAAHPQLYIYEKFNHHTKLLQSKESARIDSTEILRSSAENSELIMQAASYYTQNSARTFLLSSGENLIETLISALETEYARGVMDGICSISTADYKIFGPISKGSERATERARSGGNRKKENHIIINNAISDILTNLPPKKLWSSYESAIDILAGNVLVNITKSGIYPAQRLPVIQKKIRIFIEKYPWAYKELVAHIKN